ncbi:DMT family transporter [Streptococcus panodentis]|uniref:EamA family transporter n=1 Tax=Streptococcus panodentis TaxID=1581472 RepID=A0ABS5AWR4_9STRE|nr:DMT family transporter [Streptococcus panodentis]MBP2620688.1 EamA family transporter [Streptococcus panodentis]
MNQYQKKLFSGICYALASGLVWGASGIFGEYFFKYYSVTTGWITSMRLIVAGLVFLLLAFRQAGWRIFDIWRERKNVLPFAFYALAGIFSVQFFFYLCIQESNAATATILQFTSPIFMLGYHFFFLKQPVSKTALLYVFLAMAGVFLMTTKGDISQITLTPLALLGGFMSALAMTLNAILPRSFAKKYGLIPTIGWGMFAAGLFSNLFAPLPLLPFQPDLKSLAISLIIALFGTALAFLLSLKAVSLVSPLIVTVLGASEPLSSAVFSTLFLGLKLDLPLILAMILVVIPMVFLSLEEGKKSEDQPIS